MTDIQEAEVSAPQEAACPRAEGDSVPRVQIRPPGRLSPLAMRELWEYRDLFTALAVRDVKLRYKQTALGVIWVILQPLVGAVIFSFVFGLIAKMDSDGVPFLLFAYTGMLGWQAFNSTLSKASACVVGNAQLVSKVYFPRLILPLSTVLSTLIDFAVGVALLVVLMAVKGILPGWGVVLMPVLLFHLILAAVGLGLYTSALMVTYRDLQYVIPICLQFLLYATPVGYSLSAVPEKWKWLYRLNPLVELIQGFRWSIVNKGELHWGYLGYAMAAVWVMFLIGTFTFKRMERRFADVI